MNRVDAMTTREANWEKPKIGFRRAFGILAPYVKKKILEQVRSVALIVLYLLFFQTIVLRIQIVEASTIAIGLAIVIAGLTLFMEGLILGLMPLGEVIGVKLPEKTNVVVILAFSFVLGVGATFAEPAIGILKGAGEGVQPWEAPLLFLILNTYPHYLIYAVGTGVGVAVVFGMLRYLHGWSLKPFIYILLIALLAATGWAYSDPKLSSICGLSWDCGAVTTGPVTVPLVLALGIGVCRVVGQEGAENSGFGVVTLASLFPILSVLVLGIALSKGLPDPMSSAEFYRPENRSKTAALFLNQNDFIGYAFQNASEEQQISLFDGSREKMLAFLQSVKKDPEKRREVFGADPRALQQWAATRGTPEQQLAVLNRQVDAPEASEGHPAPAGMGNLSELVSRNARLAFQAVVPLALFLLLVLAVILREKLPRTDEVMLGIVLAFVGMILFNIGIEIGLAKLGNQVGQRLPSSFKAVALPEQKKTFTDFDRRVVQTAIDEKGNEHKFFFLKRGNRIESLPFDESKLDPETKGYTHIPRKGPLFGKEDGFTGVLVVLVFALIMGYGATLAEPALNALGLAVEEITVGIFKKNMLMQAVALGVGVGISLGVLKIIWGIPLFWLLAPPYFILLFLTGFSTEEFVNIAWDSAGVTTGPVTVPLVLAMGLGIGNQVGVAEGFGILAMASVCPILSVLVVGLRVSLAQKAVLKEATSKKEKEGAAGS
ncbi:MAG: DUF1538 domain-containing protein [Deltaproteobacteria bacterium]|nr:DUF1538 domain-containing protein [Deltaproteobacteria bacterium]